MPSVLDQSVSKRLVTCLLGALRANGKNLTIKLFLINFIVLVCVLGAFGVHVVMNSSDSYTHAFYGKLGFVENTQDAVKGKIVMGRTF